MDWILQDLEPRRLFRFFEEVSRVPRNTYHEEQISKYLMDFAAARGLWATCDKRMNVIIKKPATPGMEGRKGVMLQGHMDMVCIKDPGVEHDFEKDPLPIYIDGEFIRSRGTTLGADDGNALALGLTLLDDPEAVHPDLTVVFTAAEEEGMIGANELDVTPMDGAYLIGLDCSFPDQFIVSSAGGARCLLRFPVQREPLATPAAWQAVKLEISGLAGGHSGKEIGRWGGNADIMLGELMARLEETFELRCGMYDGGVKANAIPVQASAVLCHRKEQAQAFAAAFHTAAEALVKLFRKTDPDIRVTMEPVALPETVYTAATQNTLLTVLELVPNGVHTYLDAERRTVESSSNLGAAAEADGMFTMTVLFRSNSLFELDELRRKVVRLAGLCGLEWEVGNQYEPWEFEGETHIVQQAAKAYNMVTGEEPGLHILHAGVEMGVLTRKIREQGRQVQALSMGPLNYDVHTTVERVNHVTLARAYRILNELIKQLD